MLYFAYGKLPKCGNERALEQCRNEKFAVGETQNRYGILNCTHSVCVIMLYLPSRLSAGCINGKYLNAVMNGRLSNAEMKNLPKALLLQ
jgi:hypothetical protein